MWFCQYNHKLEYILRAAIYTEFMFCNKLIKVKRIVYRYVKFLYLTVIFCSLAMNKEIVLYLLKNLIPPYKVKIQLIPVMVVEVGM